MAIGGMRGSTGKFGDDSNYALMTTDGELSLVGTGWVQARDRIYVK